MPDGECVWEYCVVCAFSGLYDDVFAMYVLCGCRDACVLLLLRSVFYKVDEFLEKNRDRLGEDLDRLLRQSYLSFEPPKSAAQLKQEDDEFLMSARGKAKPKQLTLGGQFKIQLDELVKKLNESAPHFIRCIKPNDSKQPQFFHGVCVHQQLKQSGAFDALGIRKRGYNFQFKHEVFISRYGPLVRDKSNRRMSSMGGSLSKRDMCLQIIKLLTKIPNLENADKNIQVGNTMVFWKAAEDRQLSSLRRQEIHGQVIAVQKVARGMMCRNRYRRLQEEIECVKALLLGVKERRDTKESCLANENKSMEDILSARIKLRAIAVRCSWDKVVENESKLTNDRIEVLNKVERIKETAPRDIDENWLNVIERARDLHLRSPVMDKLYATYKDFTERCAPLLRRIGAVLSDEDVDVTALQALLSDIAACQELVPGFAEKEEGKVRQMLEQLRKEDELMEDVMNLCSGASPNVMPTEDYSRRIQNFAAATPNMVGKKVRSAMRLVDYMMEVRELMLKSTRQASNEDVTARPVMPPPPPPQQARVSTRPPPPPPPHTKGGRSSVLVGVPSLPPAGAGVSDVAPPGGMGETGMWVQVELLMKEFDEVIAAIQDTQVSAVVDICCTEMNGYQMCISDCKKIVTEGAAALAGRNVRDAEQVISLIQDFNHNFPSRAPYLIVSTQRPDEVNLGYGDLLDVQSRKLFAVLLAMLESRAQALQTEDAAVKDILQALEEEMVDAGDLFSLEGNRPPTTSNTTKLQHALHVTKNCAVDAAYLYPTTDAIVRMGEYILSLRVVASKLINKQIKASEGSEGATTEDGEGWAELKQLIAQDKHHDSHISSRNAREIDCLRTMILDRGAKLADAEKTKELADSLRHAISEEDEGQVKYLLTEMETLPDRQRLALRSNEEIDAALDEAKVLLNKLEALKKVLGAAIDSRPYRSSHILAALIEADDFSLRHTKTLDLYVQVADIHALCCDLSQRAHRAWNIGDVDVMVSVVEEASEANVEDDEIDFVKFLVEKWREDYGAFLRALIDLNAFLEREAEVEDLNEKLNDYYFSLHPPSVETECDPGSSSEPIASELPPPLADTLREFQSRRSLETSQLDSGDSSSLSVAVDACPVDGGESSTRRESLPQVGGNIVREMVRLREQQALLASQRPVVVEPVKYTNRSLVPKELPLDEDMDDMATDQGRDPRNTSQQDEEGPTFVWYRYKGLRRFADPDLEFSRKMFSTDPIPTSVTRLKSPNEIKCAVASFRCLLGAMGDQVCNYPPMMVNEFCSIAAKSQSLADEAYCQIIKQLTANPSLSSRSKGVAILRALVEVALPSSGLEPYIEHFLRDTAELDILHALQQRLRSQSAGEGPREGTHFCHAGSLTLVKGKLLPVYLKRFCIVSPEALIINMTEDPSSRVDALLISQIREVRIRKGCDVPSKGRFPFELEMKNGTVKVFHAR